MENVELALRCYLETIGTKERTSWDRERLPPDLDRVLVFDTETSTDQYQNLLFGSARIYNRDRLEFEWLFYGEAVKGKELALLNKYANDNDIPLMPVRDFVDNIFLPEVYEAHTPCIGFNLPFDLSRIAIAWGNARKANEGRFSFKMSENPKYPHLVIKHIDSKMSFIHFTNSYSRAYGNNRHRKGPNNFRGHFLDLRTSAFALTNEGHSLDSACRLFNADVQKTRPEEHGKITPDYIDYNRNDVSATYSLFMNMMLDFEKYHLDTSPTKVYSPASIGKAYFELMGIRSFLSKNSEFPKDVLGHVMACYYGGRSEVRIRKTPVQVNLIDFLSMYPTMCILQHLWRYVTAGRIDHYDDTENVRKFVHDTELESLSSPEAWTKLNAICQVEPNEDILPARCKYGNKNTYNIGLNHVTSDETIWYSLADVIASKMLTGRSPKILRAIRFEPIGVQGGLQKTMIVGDRTIDPSKDDPFEFLMNYRNEIKVERDKFGKDDENYHRLDVLQNNIKIITNSTSYGIFVEINTTKKEDAKVQVFGNDDVPFLCERSSIERFGKEFHPIVSVLITSAARLVLALTEALLARRGAIYAFCDTDSMAIPSKCLDEVQSYFQKLSPYSFEADLFKLEKENFKPGRKELWPLYFYGISAKRYVLYNFEDDIPVTRKYSLHGLGHLLDPFNKDDGDWQEQIWNDILDLHYGLVDLGTLLEKYSDHYAVSKISISSPDIMRRFKTLNQGKDKQIRPFNFALVGISVGDAMNGIVETDRPVQQEPSEGGLFRLHQLQ